MKRYKFVISLVLICLICAVMLVCVSCKDNEYIVTFKVDDKTYETVTIVGNETITMPANPTKDGCKFVGWYKDEACTTEWIFATDKVTTNVTLYAKWSVATEGLAYKLNSDMQSYSVIGMGVSTDTDVVIPTTFNGLPVTGIGESAFAEYYLTSIIIPDSVTTIGSNAFEKCYKLIIYCEAKNWSNGLHYNWNSSDCPVIWDCKNNNKDNYGYGYEYVTIDSIRYALKDNEATVVRQPITTTVANIPDKIVYSNEEYTVTTIGSYAFRDCSSLINVVIGSSVTTIEDRAFWCCEGLSSVTIGNGVTSINMYAFYYCSGLQTVYWNATACTSISVDSYFDESIFKGCSNLTTVVIGDNVTTIPSSAFYKCSSLTSVTIGDSVTTIGYSAFYGCSSLTNMTIPSSVTAIGGAAFSGCSSLTNVVIPDGVTSIGDSAFNDCSSLQYNEYDNALYLGNENNPYVLLVKVKSLYTSSFTINENVKVIYSSAFADLGNLTSVTIGNNVTSIGSYAFQNCSGLTSVTIGNNVTTIGYSAFCGCSSLTNITIPSSVTSIGGAAFSGCSSLTNVTIPDSVTSIGYSAFYGCSSLTNVTIGKSVTTISENAFNSCSSLTKVIIPDSVTSIGDKAFYRCEGLTSVIIGSSVTIIGREAFYNCSGLTSVTIGNSVTSIGNFAFYYCSNLTSVYYTGDIAGWCEISGLEYIMSSSRTLYINNEKLRGELVIPDTVTAIKSYAFYGCTGITSIILPDSITTIGYYAFSGCSNLTSVYYEGTADDWANISFDSWNYDLTSAARYYYSETQPADEGNYWHYIDGVVTVWTKEN